MYLKEYPVEIPFEKFRIVIRKEKWVLLETERTYSKETKDSRVQRKVIGQVVPHFPGKMYPNENYFLTGSQQRSGGSPGCFFTPVRTETGDR